MYIAAALLFGDSRSGGRRLSEVPAYTDQAQRLLRRRCAPTELS